MAFENLSQNLAAPVNYVAEAYNAKATKLDADRAAQDKKALDEQTRRDADFHKVVQYAGDGLIDEAKYYAQQKGIDVPPQVYSNATFAKGLSIAGTIYADDPEKAQVFASNFMNTEGDLNMRFANGIKMAGKPISKSDREFQDYVRKEQWKIKNGIGGSGSDNTFTLGPGQTRYGADGRIIAQGQAETGGEAEAALKAYNSAISSGLSTPEQAQAAADNAAKMYRTYQSQNAGQVSGGLMGVTPIADPDTVNIAPPQMVGKPTPPPSPNQQLQNKQPKLVNADALKNFVEKAKSQGYSEQEIEQELTRLGVM